MQRCMNYFPPIAKKMTLLPALSFNIEPDKPNMAAYGHVLHKLTPFWYSIIKIYKMSSMYESTHL